MVRRTKEEAQVTRHQILDAAERVFESQGVARTSLQQVAAAAGVTRGAIYWHFKDKAELFSAMMDRVLLPCEWAVGSGLPCQGGCALAGVRLLALAPLEQLARDDRLRRVFTIAMHYTEYTEELNAVVERKESSVLAYMAEMETRLREAQAGGALDAQADPAGLALALFSLVDGLMRRWTRQPGSFDLVTVGAAALDRLLRH